MLENLDRRFKVVITNVHLSPAAVHMRQLFHCLELQRACFVEDKVRVGKLLVAFVELGKLDPYFAALAECLERVDRLNCFGEGLDHQECVMFAKLDSIEPLVHIVRILSQHDVRQQKWSAFDQSL